MKKNTLLTITIAGGLLCISASAQIKNVESIKINGYLGQRIGECIEKRVKTENVDELVEVFRRQEEKTRWQTEFWGKWVQGAIASYRYCKDPVLFDKIKSSAEAMMQAQLPNGYIGNYAPDAQLQQWDIWGRKYTTLGLVAYYDLTGDKNALTAACRVIDHLMTQVGEGKTPISTTGNYHGMASMSILEPVTYIYNRTKNTKYLDFAKYIVAQFEVEGSSKIISKALAGVPVSQRYPHPSRWFSPENGQKAYEMMSCYEGLLEMYKITGNALYLSVVEKTVQNIINDEINIAGSGSAFECWYGGHAKQTMATYHTMETCVTFTWMQLCNRLLDITGNPVYANQLEKTMYNALLASLKGDATQISKYSPLEGVHTAGEEQCGMHINCCNANGPRAFAMIPAFMYKVAESKNIINVNVYAQSDVVLDLGSKNKVTLKQETDYPKTGNITISVDPSKPTAFTLQLRIPEWSAQTKITVNGSEIPDVLSGAYLAVNRTWKKGDKITVNFDMRARIVRLNQAQAIVRGPIVMARDSRFDDGDVDEVSFIADKNGYVELTPVSDAPFAWMTFTVPMVLGTDLEGHSKPRIIHICDFSSAGNTWDSEQRYRVWLPETLNVQKMPYEPYNQETHKANTEI